MHMIESYLKSFECCDLFYYENFKTCVRGVFYCDGVRIVTKVSLFN